MAEQKEDEQLQRQEPTSSSIAGKWWGLVSALWVQAISGNNYTFSNYSVALKAVMGINQVQLNGLSSAKDVGKAFGVVAGFLSDILPPWTILLIGSLEGLVGYGVQWLVISQTIQPLPYWLMGVVMCMGGNSTTWMNTAVLVTCVRNFRRNRGPISGILKGYVGLSTAIFTDLCASLFTSNASAFVLMLSLIPLAVCTIAMFLLRPVEPAHNPNEAQEESRCFSFLNVVAIVLAIYLLVYDLVGIEDVLVSRIYSGGLLVVIAIPAILPVYLHLKVAKKQRQSEASRPLLKGDEEQQVDNRRDEVITASRAASETSKADGEKPVAADGEKEKANGVAKQPGRPAIGEEHKVIDALKTPDFWLLFVCFLCGVGTGMAFQNNLGQIAESLGYTSSAIFVSLTSIFGFFGRLGSGELSEYMIRWRGVPRPAMLAASQVVMTAGYALLATAVTGSLYVGSIVVGTCYGVRLAVSVPVASELFGLKPLGLIYNLLILNLPLGSFLFSSLLAGFLYDIEAAKDSSSSSLRFPTFSFFSSSSTTCLGAHCYRVVFIVMAAVSALGVVLDAFLVLRTRSLYLKIQRTKRADQ